MRLRTTSEQSYHDYSSGWDINRYSTTITKKRFINTKATSIGGGVLADNAGYLATLPQRTTSSTSESHDDVVYDDDDEYTENPPEYAPLGFGWDVIILLLLLAIGYTLSIRKRVNPNRSLDLG